MNKSIKRYCRIKNLFKLFSEEDLIKYTATLQKHDIVYEIVPGVISKDFPFSVPSVKKLKGIVSDIEFSIYTEGIEYLPHLDGFTYDDVRVYCELNKL